jgi:hypothetical protein
MGHRLTVRAQHENDPATNESVAGRRALHRFALRFLRRTREIGVRVAVGAHGQNVLWLVLRETLALTLFGIAIGTLPPSPPPT